MNEIIKIFEVTFGPLVIIFTVSNLAVMGLKSNLSEVIAGLKNKKALVLIIVWGWVLGPALALLIAWIIPISEFFVIGLLLYSLAPCAPFLPLMVPKARGEMSFAGALVPIVAVGTVIFTPLLAPLLIEGVALSSGALAKLFLTSVLLPLIIGAVLRHYAETVATKIFPLINIIAKLSTVGSIVWACVLYGRQMLDTAGSFGLLSMTIFMIVIGWITYQFGFGLKQSQRSVMSLGMLTRNGAVVLLAAMAIPDVNPLVITYVVMYVVWSLILAVIAASIFGKLAGKTIAEGTA